MKYLSWAAFYEGGSDALYFDVLLPRVIRDIVAVKGTDLVEVPDVPAVRLGKSDRSVDAVAGEAHRFRDAFHILFVHADSGGRGLQRGIANRADAYCEAIQQVCGSPPVCCVTMTPCHEMEAWLIADGTAVTSALGYTGSPDQVGLPADARSAERLGDPKQTLNNAIEAITGRRRKQAINNLFPAIAQRQNLAKLRQSATFCQFEAKLESCLRQLRIVH